MELLIALVPFFAVAGLVALILAWSLYLQPKRDGERWAEAARSLGLELEPRTAAHTIGLYSSGPTIKQRMHGVRGGMNVSVGIRIVVSGSGKNRSTHYYTFVTAYFPRTLELGLTLHPTSWLARAFEAGGSMTVGHRELDAGYRISARVGDLARATLMAPYVIEPLVLLRDARFRPFLSDDCVKLETSRDKCTDAHVLHRALDSAVDLAHRIVSARAATGPSQLELVLHEKWRAAAEAIGFTFDLPQKTMFGRCGGMHVEVTGAQSGDAWSTAFLVRFDRPLGLGLSLERQGSLSTIARLFGGQDIQTGDAVFDARFVVKGSPERMVRAALTPEVRASLVALQDQAASLVVKDDLLRAEVSWLVSEPAWLGAGVQAVARAAAALSGVSAAGVGPYRG